MENHGGPLQGRIALVTGASRGRGIGAAICRSLAAAGADLFFTHWGAYDATMDWGADEDGPARLAAELRERGVRVADLAIDLAEPDAAYRLLDAVEERFGLPTILVNNAAHSTQGGYQSLDAAGLDAHYAVNVRSGCLLAAEFARRWRGGDGGRIIFLTSGQSLGPMRGELAYVASKGAIEAFARSLAAEVGPLGITVNAVNPGPTDSGWMTDDLKQGLLPRFPLGRIGQPADAARLIAFLAGDDAAWVTGQVIHSHGGFF